MSPRSLRPWAAATLAAVVTAGCGTSVLYGGSASGGPTSGAAGTGSESSSSTSETPAPSSPITFSRCTEGKPPAGALCGIYTAPLDYAHPSAGTIGMRVVKLPATGPGTRIGSLFTNPGGPGESGVDFVEESASTYATLRQRFDIIGFDPRGVHEPDAVSCLDAAGIDRYIAADPIPDDPGERDTLLAVNKALADGCRQRSGRLLAHVGTDDVVRDLDGMRQAVGDDKLTYLGFSYGTLLGEKYAQRYPSHVRAMVLDGDVDSSISSFDQAAQQADSLEKSFAEFVRRCAARAGCPLGSNPAATVDQVLSNLDAHPVAAADGRLMGRAQALEVLLLVLYDTNVWRTLETAFAQAAAGNVNLIELIIDLFFDRTAGRYNHLIESNAAVNCLDSENPTDISAYDTRAAELQARDPHFGDSNIYGLLACAYWPVHGPPPKAIEVRGAPPILLVGATNDPATPYAWSQAVHRQIEGSVLLTRDGYSHTSYEFSHCVKTRVDTYLDLLTMPAEGTTCPSTT